MCSNDITRNNFGVRYRSIGNGTSGMVGDHHHGGDYESSSLSLKKAKKQRIPKRGPGVAELEKILREQEKKDVTDYHAAVEKGKINNIAGISSLPNTFLPSSSNSLPRNVTNFLANSLSTTPPPPHPPPVTTVPRGGSIILVDDHGDGNADLKAGGSQLGCGDVVGRSKGVYIGGSGIFLPEQTLLPIPWSSSDQTRKLVVEEPPKIATDFSFPLNLLNGSDHLKTFPSSMLQNSHGPSHPSMMNLFPLSAIPSASASTPSSSSSSAGVYYHHVEPPSNQKSCHNYTPTVLPNEQDKMIGAKRVRPNNFPVDNRLPTSPHMPCPPLSFHPQISRLDTASSSGNHGHVFNLGTSSRDPMPSLELKTKTCVGNDNALITLTSPTTPLPSTTHDQNCQPNFSKFINQFPFQEMKESNEDQSLLQRSSLSGSEVLSVQKKSFFSFFLQPEDQQIKGETEPTSSLKNEKYCTAETGDFIDLNLKL